MSAADAAVARAAFAFVGAFVDELARSGVRHACIAPGSRSTPLALLLAAEARIRTWMHVDERSLAFFALGLARRLGEPVALLCTSGTAAANFLPAIAEARQGRVGLVVLTADRPPELRDAGAAQTIDQVRLYGAHAKWSVDVATPDASPALLRHARTLACRAASTARAAPAGPVHLNFPLREPLVPVRTAPPADLSADDRLAWTGRANGEPWTRVHEGVAVPDAAAALDVLGRLRAARRPVLVCGPQADPALAAPLVRLARALGAPILADPLSGVRWGAHRAAGDDVVIDAYDALLRDERAAAALAPDVVVRVGAVPTSTTALRWIAGSGAPLVVVDAAGWPEPTGRAAEVVRADPAAWARVAAIGLENGEIDAAHARRMREIDGAVDGIDGAPVSASGTRARAGGAPPDSNIAAPASGNGTAVRSTGAEWRDAGADAGGPPPTSIIAANAPASATDPAPIGAASRGAWLARWQAADRRARRALDAHADGCAEPFEGRVLRDAAAALPPGATLWVSSSMPVRDLDAFAAGDARPLHVLANRGANGIDGVVSSALGAAAAAAERGEGPLLLAIGDLAFYHDLNGLLAARLHAIDATILVVNNDGGGIFSFLPQAADADVTPHFEHLFGTPLGLDFAHAAALYGARFTRLDAAAAVRDEIGEALARPGLDVIEVRTDRARNVAQHRDAWAAAAAALRDDDGQDAAAEAGRAADARAAADA